MTSQGRTLAVLALFALVGVAALGFLAGRYRDLAEARVGEAASRPPSARTTVRSAPRIEAFLAVRREVKAALAAGGLSANDLLPGGAPPVDRRAGERVLAEVRRRRALALERAALSEEDYTALRDAYLGWKEGRAGLAPELREAFEGRRSELGEVDLGPYDPLGL